MRAIMKNIHQVAGSCTSHASRHTIPSTRTSSKERGNRRNQNEN